MISVMAKMTTVMTIMRQLMIETKWIKMTMKVTGRKIKVDVDEHNIDNDIFSSIYKSCHCNFHVGQMHYLIIFCCVN